MMRISKRVIEYVGMGILLLLALICIVIVTKESCQSVMPTPMPQSFKGEYSYDGVNWTDLKDGSELSALKGDLILRGHFEKDMSEGWFLSFYCNHIGVSMYVNDELVYMDTLTQVEDADTKLFASLCGRQWVSVRCPEISVDDKVEIRLYNPHSYGNKEAYKEFLATLCGDMPCFNLLQENLKVYSIPFRVYGVFLIVAAFMLLGASLAAAMIKSPFSRHLLKIGLLTVFTGGYILLDIIDISFFSELNVFNTYGRQLCIMLAVFCHGFFVSGIFTGRIKKVGEIFMFFSGVLNGVIIIASFTGVTVIFDTFPVWVASQVVLCPVMSVCCGLMLHNTSNEKRIVLVTSALMFLSVLIDATGIGANILSSGICTKAMFLVFFVTYIIIGTKNIIVDHQASVRALRLEHELEENRIAIMLSQIQPHFLYNALGTIRGLCRKDPEKAWEALGDFSKYLRCNMSALTNKENIYFSSELHHIEAYLRLEKVRMGERLNILYDIQEKDFLIPPLTVQPLVENAIKHGLFDKKEGGTLILHTRMEDDKIIITVKDNGLGFDDEAPLTQDDHHAHIGLANVRARLEKMVGGQLIVESTLGIETTATIILPIKSKL